MLGRVDVKRLGRMEVNAEEGGGSGEEPLITDLGNKMSLGSASPNIIIS